MTSPRAEEERKATSAFCRLLARHCALCRRLPSAAGMGSYSTKKASVASPTRAFAVVVLVVV